MTAFRLLGPLEVDGAEALPSRAEATVLVLLLLNAGRVVGIAQLVDALWGEALPADPANAVQQRVSRLRRSLGVTGRLISHRSGGYVLDVDADAVDAHRFATIVAEARSVAGSDAAAAERRYAKALALWRGPALAEFADAVWAQPYSGRLEELRLSAIEERIELGLAAGRHTELVGELEALTGSHPLRERLHGQLMLALYRSGRQGDALAVYRRLRERLTADLGLDPTPALRDLESAVLRQDPGLGSPAAQLTAPPLPVRLASVVGRAAEVDRAVALLDAHRLVTLTGPGGVGKTTLAGEVAARLAANGADAVYLVSLAGVAESARVDEAVAVAVGVDPAKPGPLVGLLRIRPAVVVLDNCEHVADACAALAARLLGACPALRILATSREPLAVSGEAQMPVPPLAEDDAVRLFVQRARAARPDFVLDAASAAAVARICRSLDGLPLAIELAAPLVRTLPPADLAGRLDDRFALLTGGSRTADARHRTLRATLQWSHQLLTASERVLFRRLAVFRGGWRLDAAERICAGGDLDRASILGLLAQLVDRSLVVADPGGDGRFHLLETVWHYARERLVDGGEEAEFAARHARDVMAVTEAAEPQLRGPAQDRWLVWWRTERDNVSAALRWCRAHSAQEPDVALRLVATLGWFGYFASRPDVADDITDVLASTPHGSPHARARALQARALAARPNACVVHPDAACAAAARESLEGFAATGDDLRAAYSRALLAVEGIAGAPGSADLLDRADADFDRAGDRWGRALVRFVRMDLDHAAGDLTSAERHGAAALAAYRDLDDHWGVSAVRFHRGMALHRAGRPDEAGLAYEDALAEGRRAGLANTVQYALAHLGHVALALDDPDGAEARFAEAHAVARALGTEGNPLAALGEGHLARGRNDLAAAHDRYTAAIRLLEGVAAPEWTAAAHSGLGFVAELSGDPAAAAAHHRTARELAAAASPPGDPVTGAAPAVALEGLACAAIAGDDGAAAAGLLAEADAWRRRHQRPRTASEERDAARAARGAS